MNLETVPDIDETTQHRLLADEQRRFVITSLQTARSGVDMTLDEITAHLERAAERTRSEHIGSRRDLRCRLHHVHLPMLADAGLLDYDAEKKRVRLGAPWAVTASAETP
ncbi:hypothetical protein EGH22_18960 [Halomicroarcula sp. F28]|uniref:DUF7344 domain-containing protein n=1 Tax=Haloarcula salinisoli TaxID=2487746 RepID=UPI001C731932|nr:hypothetical protein [Halomicroarcula salinisoli]MBX0288415.1 hypothetical protein [Halomicroarcula salinisoli]